MKYMMGYKICDDDRLVDGIIENKEHIYEVYFAFGDIANGRNNQLTSDFFTPWEAQEKQLADLKRLSEAGIALNLLFNGNCYGKDSQSRAFFNKVGEITDFVSEKFGLASVTTTSPLIAKFMKNNFEDIEVRASVNMKIGTICGMDYVAEYFDSYYMQREYNRDFERIKQLKAWCDENGKKLFMLANSGCLNNCSAQTFHDNLVSHESEISAMDNAYAFTGMCHEYLKDEAHYKALIENTNFVRPEDMHLYDEYFAAAKLATRVSRDPINTLKSYIAGKYVGNILDILEPSHSIYPYILENGSPLRLVKLDENMPMYEYKENSCR